MKIIPVSLRHQIVKSNESGASGSYEETAELFGVSVATVNRF